MSIFTGHNPFAEYLEEKEKAKKLEGYTGNLYSHIYDYTTDHKGHVIYTIHVAERSGSVELVYVGKAKNGIGRPRDTYEKMVDNFENKVQRKLYRKDDNGVYHVKGMKNNWRKNVHPPLSDARKNGKVISLTLVNPGTQTEEELNAAEREAMKDAIIKYGKNKVMNTADVKSIIKEIEKEIKT